MLNHSLLNTQVVGAACGAQETAIRNQPSITKHVGADGATVYCLPFESPATWASTAILLLGKPITLIHPGPTWDLVHATLADSFADLRERFGEPVGLCDIQRLILTHNDLFGPPDFPTEKLAPRLEQLIEHGHLKPTKPDASQLATHPPIVYEPA